MDSQLLASANQQTFRRHRLFRRWLATVLFYPAVLLAILPLLKTATAYAQAIRGYYWTVGK